MEDVIVENQIEDKEIVNTQIEDNGQVRKEEKVEKLDTPDTKTIEAIQKKAFGYAMQMIDEKLEEIGFKKPENVKTTDFIKQIISDKGTKEAPSSVKESDDDNIAKIKALQEQLRERESKIVELSESTTKQKRDFFLKSLIDSSEIQASESLGEAEKTRYIERIKRTMENELLNNYQVKEVEGNFKLYAKDGSPIFDGTPDMNIIDPRELIKRDFSEFLTAPTKQKQVVRGTGNTETGQKINAPQDFPSAIKTKSDLYDHIESKGLKMGSKEFLAEVTKAKSQMPHLFN
jgi:hypothetical protein